MVRTKYFHHFPYPAHSLCISFPNLLHSPYPDCDHIGEWNGQGNAPDLTSCSSYKHLTYDDIKTSHQKVTTGKLVFSYGVEWRRSEVHWASRWDIYLSMNGAVPDKVSPLSQPIDSHNPSVQSNL